MRRAKARAEYTEKGRASRGQVRGHVEGSQRSEQRRQKSRGENETGGGEDRNKLSTRFIDKQKPGDLDGQGGGQHIGQDRGQ